MTERKRELAELLQRQFGCEQPFIDPPEYIGKNTDGVDLYVYFTEDGKRAYVDLLKLMFELEFLDVIDDSILVMRNINQIIIDQKEDD